MREHSRGFSLIEIVVAIVIMSIIAIGLVDFIVNSSVGYVQAASRSQLSAAGRVVLDRVSMDLHNALPESVRISDPMDAVDETAGNGYAGDQCLEFIPVLAATTYINPRIRPAARTTTFNVIDFVPEQDGVTDVYVVIYPTSSADLYAASFSGNTTEAIAGASIADTNNTDGINEVTTTTNHRFKRASSVERIFLTSQPVSYCITGTKLYRYQDYDFSATPLLPVRPDGDCAAGPDPEDCLPTQTPDRVLITDQLDNGLLTGGVNGQAFDQLVASRHRNGVIQLELNFAQDGEAISLNHEVLQQVTP